MLKRYWWILITYILCQLSGILPGLYYSSHPITEAQYTQVVGLWIVGSFIIALIVTLLLLTPEFSQRHDRIDRASGGETILWMFLGIVMAFVAQIVAANIEINLFGASPSSKNTEDIIKLTKAAHYIIFVVAIIGPILEEVIFRKIIFGSLYKKTNFFIAALASSLIFALAHWDKHILMYTMMGFVFAFLYTKTKRIIVPIVAHASMNAIVVLVQIVFADDIQKMLNQKEALNFIGGLFS